MIRFFAVIALFGFVQDVPFKPASEFEAAVDLQFKSRPATEQPAYDANGSRFEKKTGVLPYFSVNLLHISSTKGEMRFKAIDATGKSVGSKKLLPSTSYRFEMGFIEDLKKETVSTSTITVFFLNDKKVEISKVVLSVTKEGDFLVNGEKRGQF